MRCFTVGKDLGLCKQLSETANRYGSLTITNTAGVPTVTLTLYYDGGSYYAHYTGDKAIQILKVWQ